MTHWRLTTITLVAALLIAFSAATATASRSFSVVGGGRAVLAISLTGGLTFGDESGRQVIDLMTLHGSIHRLVGKTRGALVGVITSGLMSARGELCRTSGAFGLECKMSALLFPWHLQLESFTGTLPSIRSIRLRLPRIGFRLITGRVSLCLYEGSSEVGAATSRIEPGGSTIERLTFLNPNLVSLSEAHGEEFFRRCARRLEFLGGLTLAPLIIIRLH